MGAGQDHLDKLGEMNRSKLAAIAYVSKGCQIHFEEGDTLVCDASRYMIRTGQTDARVLEAAVNLGAIVYSYPGLHAKVLVVGETAVIGSANLSESSRDLTEAAVVTDEPRLVGQAIAFVDSLASDNHRRVRVRGKMLEDLLKIKVVRKGGPPRGLKRRTRRWQRTDGSGWLSTCRPIRREGKGEAKRVTAVQRELEQRTRPGVRIEPFRLPRNCSIARNAHVGQTLILAWRASKTASVEVWPPVFIQRRLVLPEHVYLFYEEAESDRRQLLGWREFVRLLAAAGHTRPTTPRSVLPLAPSVVAHLSKHWPRTRR